MAKKHLNRKTLERFVSEDGTVEFKYYETGFFVGVFTDLPLTKNGAEDAFIRVNSLQFEPDEVSSMFKRLVAFFTPLADRELRIHIEYSKRYRELLDTVLSIKDTPALELTIAFNSAVSTFQQLSSEEFLKLIEDHKHLMPHALRLKAYDGLFKDDLGLINLHIPKTKDTTKETHEELQALMLTPWGKLFRTRLFVENADFIERKVDASSNSIGMNRVLGALTDEEFSRFISVITELKINRGLLYHSTLVKFAPDSQRSIYYALVYAATVLTQTRLRDLIEFVMLSLKPTNETRYYRDSIVCLPNSEQELYDSDVYLLIHEAMEDENTPIAWLAEINV